MSLARLLNRPCTITHREPGAGRDRYGNSLPDEVTVEALCELQQQSRGEDAGRQEISETKWMLVLPAGTVIAAADTVTVDGVEYEVEGDPWRARNPRTQAESHVEATVRRTSTEDAHAS